MLTFIELEKWLKDLNNIIFDCKISIDNIKRMTLPKDEHERHILNHGFFSHFYLSSRFTIIVQLCKIFAKTGNQKINLIKMFKRFKDESYDSDLNESILNNNLSYNSLNSKTIFIDKINSFTVEIKKNDEIILKLITLRDKHYAHRDPSANLPNLKDFELELLIDLAIKIYNSLSLSLMNTTFMFDMNADWTIDYPIKILAKNRKERLEIIANKLK